MHIREKAWQCAIAPAVALIESVKIYEQSLI